MKKSGMNGLTGLGIMIALSGVLVGVSEPLYKAIAGRNRPISDVPVYQAGVYEGTARGYGGPVTVTVKLSEYEIEDIKIDAPDETPEVGKAVAARLSKEIWMQQSHSIDSVSGATMTSNAIKKAMADCFRQAVKEGTELAEIIAAEKAQEESQKALPDLEELLLEAQDGTYRYRDAENDGNGFFNVIELAVKDHKIVSLYWDAVNEEGVGKRTLSKEGQYIMTENGPKWYEQADMAAQYVLDRQTTEGILNESGTSDAIASVSIHLGGFVDSLKRCLADTEEMDDFIVQ